MLYRKCVSHLCNKELLTYLLTCRTKEVKTCHSGVIVQQLWYQTCIQANYIFVKIIHISFRSCFFHITFGLSLYNYNDIQKLKTQEKIRICLKTLHELQHIPRLSFAKFITQVADESSRPCCKKTTRRGLGFSQFCFPYGIRCKLNTNPSAVVTV